MRLLPEFDFKKTTQVINYFAKKEGGQIDKLKLIKLIYLCERYHLRHYGRPITNDAYFAMPLGPVGSATKEISEFSTFLPETELEYIKKYLAKGAQEHTVVSLAEVDGDVLSDTELKTLDLISKNFGGNRPSSLVNVTHRYPEWTKFKKELDAKITTRQPMAYADFFENPRRAQNDIFDMPDEKLEAARELFEEDYKIAEFWR